MEKKTLSKPLAIFVTITGNLGASRICCRVRSLLERNFMACWHPVQSVLPFQLSQYGEQWQLTQPSLKRTSRKRQHNSNLRAVQPTHPQPRTLSSTRSKEVSNRPVHGILWLAATRVAICHREVVKNPSKASGGTTTSDHLSSGGKSNFLHGSTSRLTQHATLPFGISGPRLCHKAQSPQSLISREQYTSPKP